MSVKAGEVQKDKRLRITVYLSARKVRRLIRKLKAEERALELGAALGGALGAGAAGVAAAAATGPLAVAAGVATGAAALAGAGLKANRLQAQIDLLEDVLADSNGRGVNVVLKQTRRDGNFKGLRLNYYARGRRDPKCGTRVTDGAGNTALDISRC